MTFDDGTDRLLSTLLVVGTALVQGQISATVASSVTTVVIPAWAALFAGFNGLMTCALAIVFWLLITTIAHIICLVMDGRGAYGRFVVCAGYGYLPYFLTTLITLVAVIDISPQISAALESGEMIGAPLRARLRWYGALNNAAQVLLFGWVIAAARRVHGVTMITGVVSVLVPVGAVLLARGVLIA